MATKLRVTYADGRVEDVLATPRAQVMTEEFLHGVNDANIIRFSYHLAWTSLHTSGREPDDYDTWLDKIADVDEVPRGEHTDADGRAVDPTRPVLLRDGSSG